MSGIRDIARDSLLAAQGDLAKARRLLPLAAGLLALIHLLTVHPYIQATRQIAVTEAAVGANDALVAGLDPNIARLQKTAEDAGNDLQNLMADTTRNMVARFTELRQLVQQAQTGQVPQIRPREDLFRDLGNSHIQMNMAQSAVQQAPPVQQQEEEDTGSAAARALPDILDAVASHKPDAMDRLTAYARTYIVKAAYADAQQRWKDDIQPGYLQALAAAVASVSAAADKAATVSATDAASLRKAAADLARQRDAIAAVEISPDNTLNAALGGDWWRTVQGKDEFADALVDSIVNRMKTITGTARAPADAIRDTIVLQKKLQDDLMARRADLEKQFAEHRQQLATLSGAEGAIPVDLKSFIGVFPLVIGIVLGVLLLRGGQARRQAAMAADGLARAGEDDKETLDWLALRALGGNAAGCRLAGIAMAGVVLAWIAFAAWQIAGDPETPPLPPWLSAAIGGGLVVAATVWDLASIQRLAARLKG